MKNTVDFLNDVKAAHGLTSDYQLAKHLDVTRQRISNNMRRGEVMNEDMAGRVAKSLKLPLEHVLASVAAEKSKTAPARKAWEVLAKHAAGMAAALAIVVVTVGGSASFGDFQLIQEVAAAPFNNNIHYTHLLALTILALFTLSSYRSRL